jgi:hypothetical protein
MAPRDQQHETFHEERLEREAEPGGRRGANAEIEIT